MRRVQGNGGGTRPMARRQAEDTQARGGKGGAAQRRVLYRVRAARGLRGHVHNRRRRYDRARQGRTGRCRAGSRGTYLRCAKSTSIGDNRTAEQNRQRSCRAYIAFQTPGRTAPYPVLVPARAPRAAAGQPYRHRFVHWAGPVPPPGRPVAHPFNGAGPALLARGSRRQTARAGAAPPATWRQSPLRPKARAGSPGTGAGR